MASAIGNGDAVAPFRRRNEGEWCLRLQYDDRQGRFLKQTWPSAEEVQRWVEANAYTVTR